MFQKTKNIDPAFRHIKAFSFLLVAGCFLLSGFVLYKSYELSAQVPSTSNSLTSISSRNVLNSVSSDASMVADSFGNSRSTEAGSMASNCASAGYFNDKNNNRSYIKDKLSGKA